MNDSILKLLSERYFLKDETCWEDVAKRVSKIYSPIEDDINKMKFIPSSPTLMNASTNGERVGTLSSCFPMDIEDSIDGIGEAITECMQVTKMGGGVGYDFSNLRGSGENISSLNRESGGPLPFINILNSVLDGIQQGGVRRGAGMALLSVNHKNIVEFIEAKKDYTQNNFARFNFSTKMTDDFYEKLKKNPDLKHCVKLKSGDYIELDITTKELWDKIIHHAWLSAEPGIFNETIAYDQCTVTNISDKVLSNPCFTSDTLVLVAGEKNPISIKELADNNKKFLAYSGVKYKNRPNKTYSVWKTEIKEATAFKTGTKEVFKVTLSNGDTFKATKDHLLALFDKDDYVEVKNSLNMKLAPIFTFNSKKGKHLNINSFTNAGSKQHRMIWEYYHGNIKKGNVIHHLSYDNDHIENLECLTKKDHDDLLKTEHLGENNPIHNMDKEYQKYVGAKYSFGVNNSNSSGISNLEIIEIAKRLKKCNIEITIENLRKEDIRVPKQFGDYRFNRRIKNLIYIVENNIDYIEPSFSELEVKNPNAEEIDYSFFDKEVYVVNIEYYGIEDVYDLTVDDNHNFYIMTGKNERNDYRGILVHNCAEYINVPYTSCALGSINLSELVKNKQFDWDEFESIIAKSTRYINNTLDQNNFPIKKIKETTLIVRAIGLGFMGLAHALYKMRIPYNSEEGYSFIEKMQHYMTLRSMKESIEIAKETKNSYPAYDEELFLKANKRLFKKKKVHNIVIEELLDDLKKYGVANSAFTSTAPTGSISFIANTSSGIEPVFALSFSRKIEKLNKEYEVVYISDPVFEDYLNNNFDEKVKEKILKNVADNKGSCQKCKDMPEDMRKVFVVAGDLTPMEHLESLGKACQKVSMSISKTINLPKNVSKEEISEVFLKAHELGVIGVTCYRDGSREGILIHNSDEEEHIVERDAPKRPKELPCHVYKITVQGCKWIVFIGLLNNHPYEVFAGKIDQVDIPSSITEGVLERVKSGYYQFKADDEILIKDVTSLFINDEQEALTRQISTNLRHGTPIDFIIQQLEKSHGTIVDFSKSILRALRRYLKDKDGGLCEQCGSKMIYFDGCLKCSAPDCSWSKCG